MLREIRTAVYSPTLAVRPGEMRGLEELSEHDKDKMVPLVLLAPWVGSETLDKSIERIQQAYGNRGFFLDIDQLYESDKENNLAQNDFRALRVGDDRISRWMKFVAVHDNVIPIIQHRGATAASLAKQVSWAEGLGRGYGFRFDDPSESISADALKLIEDIGHSDFAAFLDSGWSRDSLAHEFWFATATSSIVQRNQTLPIVTATSNFPKTFSDIEGVHLKRIGAREVFSRVRASSNNATLIYGDWASTKPRAYDRAGPPLPRIDYATRTDWVIARNKEKGWSFPEAALAVKRSAHWNPAISTWGSYMVEKTAANQPFGIDTTPKAVAARVNTHLHMQTNFAIGDASIQSDDPWVDD